METVFSHNIVRNLGAFFPFINPNIITEKNLLTVARVASIPLAAIASLVASLYRSSHSAGATGYLLIVAFDVVLASVVVPLFGCFYTKKPSYAVIKPGKQCFPRYPGKKCTTKNLLPHTITR
jgi:hypothetical protein